MIKVIKGNFTLVLLLSWGLLVFTYSYFNNIYRPGAESNIGWYQTWSDQRRYYAQTKAFTSFKINPDTFQFPILYPLLGALLLPILPQDPFLVVNVILFLITLFLTYLIISKSFGKEKGLYGMIMLISINRFVYDFVTPWTTSLTAPLFLGLFFITQFSSYSLKKSAIATVLIGLVGLTRPPDVLFCLPLLISFILKSRHKTVKNILIDFSLVAIVLLGFILIFTLFNFMVAGNVQGPYLERLTTRFKPDISPLVLIEKTFGYFFNPYIFHRQIEYFSSPVIVSIPIALLLLLNISRISTISIIVSFLIWYLIYIPYDVLSAYTLKNLSLHYLKPWYPIGILYVFAILDKNQAPRLIKRKTLLWYLSTFLFLIILPFAIQKLQPRQLIKTDWATKTSTNNESANKIIDNNLKTLWSSDRPRKRGEVIEIDLKKIFIVSRLRLIDETPNAATNFDTLLSEDGKSWRKLARNYTYNVRFASGWHIVGYMKKARYIKLILNEESPTDAWHIKDIDVFGY